MNISAIARKANKLTCDVLAAPVEFENLEVAFLPVSVEYSLEEMPDDVSGFITYKHGKYFIVVNENHPETRRRFTQAHELGHYVLGHLADTHLLIDSKKESQFKLYRSEFHSNAEYAKEREANIFAANLLMPERLVIEEIQSTVYDEMDLPTVIESLSEKFKVSKEAMYYRLVNLGIISQHS